MKSKFLLSVLCSVQPKKWPKNGQKMAPADYHGMEWARCASRCQGSCAGSLHATVAEGAPAAAKHRVLRSHVIRGPTRLRCENCAGLHIMALSAVCKINSARWQCSVSSVSDYTPFSRTMHSDPSAAAAARPPPARRAAGARSFGPQTLARVHGPPRS